MFSIKKNIYQLAPQRAQRLLSRIPYSWLAGANYRQALALSKEAELFDAHEVREFQLNLLKKTLDFAVTQVPFYKPFKEAVDDLPPELALLEFPVLNKSAVQENKAQLIPDIIAHIPHHTATTGGSTGNQLEFFEDDTTYAREMGHMHTQWARVGYRPSLRKATFRGVSFSGSKPRQFWQYNPIHNELQFSPFEMTEENLAFYVKKLKSYKPSYLHGYPSAVSCIAEYVLRLPKSQRPRGIAAALLGSEACSAEQRERIEKAFETRVFTWYGQSERVILASECEASTTYHSMPSYGYLEILDLNGKECKEGKSGEIVGTGFLNRSMPLIRYATDDHATKIGAPCSHCGRKWQQFDAVEGRWNTEAFLTGRHGSNISAAALNMHGDMFANVVRYQYYQDTPGKVTIRVMCSPEYSEADAKAILKTHHQKAEA
ncbi:MAG: hypothetical protein KJO81_01010, partial [Gammaproteobacteria bacterium]|nr:hypothetical protein [Gammaproteobacteria bacterium]